MPPGSVPRQLYDDLLTPLEGRGSHFIDGVAKEHDSRGNKMLVLVGDTNCETQVRPL